MNELQKTCDIIINQLMLAAKRKRASGKADEIKPEDLIFCDVE